MNKIIIFLVLHTLVHCDQKMFIKPENSNVPAKTEKTVQKISNFLKNELVQSWIANIFGGAILYQIMKKILDRNSSKDIDDIFFPTFPDTNKYKDFQLPECLEEMKKKLEEEIKEDKFKEQCYLFHGKPGTGKTESCRIMAAQLGFDLIQIISAGDAFVGKYVGERPQLIKKAFKKLNELVKDKKALIVFDEIDTLRGRSRASGADSSQNAEGVNSFLTHIDRFLENEKHNKTIIIGTTNFIDNVDDAIQSRFSKKIEFDFPEPKAFLTVFNSLQYIEDSQDEDQLNRLPLSFTVEKESIVSLEEYYGKDKENIGEKEIDIELNYSSIEKWLNMYEKKFSSEKKFAFLYGELGLLFFSLSTCKQTLNQHGQAMLENISEKIKEFENLKKNDFFKWISGICNLHHLTYRQLESIKKRNAKTKSDLCKQVYLELFLNSKKQYRKNDFQRIVQAKRCIEEKYIEKGYINQLFSTET